MYRVVLAIAVSHLCAGCVQDYPPTPARCSVLSYRSTFLFVPDDGPPETYWTFGLSRTPHRESDGRVACQLTEALPDAGLRCSSLSGRMELTAGETGVQCLVEQHPYLQGTPPREPGWYFDDTESALAGGGPFVRYVPGSEPLARSRVTLECVLAQEGTCEL